MRFVPLPVWPLLGVKNLVYLPGGTIKTFILGASDG